MTNEEYIEAINQQRMEKDKGFASAFDSPIPRKERADFGGLKYYPPDPAYVFLVHVHPNPNEREIVKLGATKGDLRDFLKVGTISFTVADTACQLSVYTDAAGYDGNLFVPFRDATSGQETYGAGRYIDLELADDDGSYFLDFNQAYSPWCSYSEQYSCVLPPQENWLTVKIAAGEKTYAEH